MVSTDFGQSMKITCGRSGLCDYGDQVLNHDAGVILLARNTLHMLFHFILKKKSLKMGIVISILQIKTSRFKKFLTHERIKVCRQSNLISKSKLY